MEGQQTKRGKAFNLKEEPKYKDDFARCSCWFPWEPHALVEGYPLTPHALVEPYLLQDEALNLGTSSK